MMKKILSEILYGDNSIKSGLFAFAIIGLIVLGCTCNTKDGFKFGKKDSNTTQDKPDDGDKKPTEKSDASTGDLPSEDELQEITKTSLLSFNDGMQTKNFKDFYDNTSKPFKKSTSPRRLKRQFRKLIEGKADISSIRSMKARFSPSPRVNDSGRIPILEIKGDYATKPRASTFELKYIPEGTEWKLIAIKIFTNVRRKR